MPSSAADLMKQLVHLGSWWANATGLAQPIVFARTGGGYLNCVDATSGTAAVCTGFTRRWDPRRLSPVGQIIQTCILTEVDPAHGRYLWDWMVSDLAAVPADAGIYVMQVDLLLPSGQETFSQRATFEVLPSVPSVY